MKNRRFSLLGVTPLLVVVLGPYLLGYIPVFAWLGFSAPSAFLIGQWFQGVIFSLIVAWGVFSLLLVGATLYKVFDTVFPKEEQ